MSEIHPYLCNYESDKKQEQANKIEAKKQYMREYKKTYIKSEKAIDKDRELNLAKYHRQKKLTHCEICNESFYYITKHKLTAKHMNKVSNPIDVIKDLFPNIMETLLNEADSIKQTKNELEVQLNAMIVKPLIPTQTKKRYGAAIRFTFTT